MCFSAQASFITAFGLLLAYVATMRNARTNYLKLITLTTLFFAVQQAAEGVVWLTFNNAMHAQVHTFAIAIFMFFAGIFWPTWIPSVLYAAENKKNNRKIIASAGVAGYTFALLFACCWIFYGLQVKLINHHIQYSLALPASWPADVIYPAAIALYAYAVIAPLLVCSVVQTWLAGIIVAAALVVSTLFFYQTFGSVWCFFAAVASALIYFVVRKK